jgi:hypothetical protein
MHEPTPYEDELFWCHIVVAWWITGLALVAGCQRDPPAECKDYCAPWHVVSTNEVHCGCLYGYNDDAGTD